MQRSLGKEEKCRKQPYGTWPLHAARTVAGDIVLMLPAALASASWTEPCTKPDGHFVQGICSPSGEVTAGCEVRSPIF